MTLKKWAGAAIAAAAFGGLFGGPAAAQQDQVVFVHNTYRTGPFAGSGTPVANGVRDYFLMLNARDGGIGGARIVFEECETQYDTRRSVECYEQGRARGSILYVPWSTGATLAAIPRAHVDRMPILSMAYGLSASANGQIFPWVFNPPATYWDGASVFLSFVAQQEGGLQNLRGKRIGLLHLDAPFGREPIPVLETLARQYGFTLQLYPVPATEMQNQSSIWLAIRRDRPDWILLQGWGAMNPTAVREAGRAGFRMDRMIGIWWAGSDDDARPAGPQGRGYRALNWHAPTLENTPLLRDIMTHVVERGQSLAPRERITENFYGRGVYQAVIIAEAIRNAQRLTGRRSITGEDMRRGLETLDITAERWTELGLPGFAAPVSVSCSDHNGHHGVYVMQWDGSRWQRNSEWIAPQRELVRPLIDEAAQQYAAQNQGWPQRTESCDGR
jgi:branched-chain amino acid transport system substrate-binding protein